MDWGARKDSGEREDGPLKHPRKTGNGGNGASEPITAVVLIETASIRRSVAACLTANGVACIAADTPAHAADLMSAGDFDVVVIDDPAARRGRKTKSNTAPYKAVRKLATAHPSTGVVVVAERPGLDDAIAAMQAGASDLIPAATDEDELFQRILAAAGRSGNARQRWAQREERTQKLKRLCRGLNQSRHELSKQVSSLCANLAGAYRELAEQMSLVTLASEFNSIIRQELDLENLLRVGVEFLLGKTGPTNTAVFLPATTGDYSLGAYVNYDCPKDSAEMLMDQLAASVAPRVDAEASVLTMNTPTDVSARLGDASEWLEGMSVMTAACRHENECLAVIVVFRPASAPFPPEVTHLFGVIAGLFAKQLARVIHVHHRHLPKHKWGFPGDTAGGADDIDLAA